MKILLVGFLLFAFGLALEEAQYRFLFESFRSTHNKMYGSAMEALLRYDIFKQNVDLIKSYNSEGHSTTLDINQFADMTESEFSSFLELFELSSPSIVKDAKIEFSSRPEEVDWEKKGFVHPIRDQGQVSSSGLFSACGALESSKAISTEMMEYLSVQHLIDCVEGGMPEDAFDYAVKEGICTDSEYPFIGRKGDCKKCANPKKFRSYSRVTEDDMDAFQDALAQRPVSTLVDAAGFPFQFYRGGIIGSGCGTTLNHALLAIGYGTDNGTKYYRLQNTWGRSWGELGYVRILREDGSGPGVCGVTHHASYPVY